MKNELVIPEDVIMISEINEKGVFTFVNDDYCKVTGY